MAAKQAQQLDDGLQFDDRQHVYPEVDDRRQQVPCRDEKIALHSEQALLTTSPTLPGYHAVSGCDDEVERRGQDPSDWRRICGMSRKLFIWLLVALIIVVFAAVVGGVLGATLGKKRNVTATTPSSNGTNGSGNPATEASDLSGLALLSATGSQTMYGYYANELGSIVEVSLPAAPSSQSLSTRNTAVVNVSRDALPHSSIAAVSYTLNGTMVRRIFYFGSPGGLFTIATGPDGTWASASTVASSIQPSHATAGLSAIANNSFQGIRVYFGCQQGYIQESGYNFGRDNGWHDWMTFPDGDANAGVASVMTDNVTHVYLRSKKSAALVQWQYNFSTAAADPGQPWVQGPSLSQPAIASNGSLAATTDGLQTDYIWYQSATNNGQAQLATAAGNGLNLNIGSAAATALQDVQLGAPLVAAWNGAAAVVAAQNASAPAEVLLATFGGEGGIVSGRLVTG